MEPRQVEYRRRIWSYLYHADRSYALALGRPNAIQDDYTSARPPSNIDDENPSAYDGENPSLATPTPMTFVILRHQLAKIIGKMVHHFQQVKERSSYTEVAALDDELLRFVSNLPPHYALQPNTSLDEQHGYIPIHRFLLITEILFVRISLHRPYLLRRLRSDRFARSRAACFESAIKDFEVRKLFRESVKKETRDSLGNAYREFQTAMISGIYLVIEPRGRDAAAMRSILDGFLEEYEGAKEIDETTRREIKTIEFLRNKASQVESHYSSPNPMNDHATGEQQAQLLLNLHQGIPSSSSRPFPSLLSIPSSEEQGSTPHIPHLNSAPMVHSPTFQRLQANSASSPTGSGSPGDDESTAQSLLDHWCSTVSNAPVDASTSNMLWGGPGGADLTGWIGVNQPMAAPDQRLLNSIDGSDWNYWETLINQIQRTPN
jgi:hypothetical protein